MEEMLLSGKVITTQSVNTLVDTGMYQLKNCTDTPVEMTPDREYLLTVEATGKLVKQTFFDGENNSLYIRPIYNAVVGEWIPVGKITSDSIASIADSLGDISSLKTTSKTTVVSALNGLQSEVNTNKTGLTKAKEDIVDLSQRLTTHNHDDAYLSVNGGDLKGNTAVANNVSFQGKNTSGTKFNIGKVDESNNVAIGDTAGQTVIQASNGSVKVFDGVKSNKVFHEGNMGHGSGLNADMVDGVDGSNLARLDVANYFKGDQFIQESKNLVLKASSGSSVAGAIYFRDGDNLEKGRISVNVNGDISFFAGGNNNHTVKATGVLLSSHDHIMDASTRDLGIKWRNNSADSGIGFYMNGSTDRLCLYDWKNQKSLFTTDRESGMVSFTNHIAIQGHKLYIQASAPSSPKAGDIWFDL